MLSTRMCSASVAHGQQIASLKDQLQRILLDTLNVDQKLSARQNEFGDRQATLEILDKEIESKMNKADELKSLLEQKEAILSSIEQDIKRMEGQIAEMECEQEKVDEKSELIRKEIAQAELEIQYNEAATRKLEAEMLEDELVRRKLNEQYSEIQWKIRVICRIRPPKAEIKRQQMEEDSKKNSGKKKKQQGLIQKRNPVMEKDSSITVRVLDDRFIRMEKPSTRVTGEPFIESHDFEFDKTFGPGSLQEDVYQEVSTAIQSALDGHLVCIFAYGQTGSGKTFTMEGPSSAPGLVPRSLEHIFKELPILQEKGWEMEIFCSTIEVYGSQVFDLQSSSPESALKVFDCNGVTKIPDLYRRKVEGMEDVRAAMDQANAHRKTKATFANSTSSRSHLIVQLDLVGTHASSGKRSEGKLSLVDLAGSESGEAAADPTQMKEGREIRKSLGAIQKVLGQLKQSKNKEMISYRDSKLTQVMRNSLSPGTKVVMLVHVGPEEEESKHSLKFGADVQSILLGPNKVRVKDLNQPKVASSKPRPSFMRPKTAKREVPQ
jgi:kinesin family member C1